jgi:hypothetical protein
MISPLDIIYSSLEFIYESESNYYTVGKKKHFVVMKNDLLLLLLLKAPAV